MIDKRYYAIHIFGTILSLAARIRADYAHWHVSPDVSARCSIRGFGLCPGTGSCHAGQTVPRFIGARRLRRSAIDAERGVGSQVADANTRAGLEIPAAAGGRVPAIGQHS